MIQIDECCLIVCPLTGLGDDAFCLREAGLDDTFERQGTPADGQEVERLRGLLANHQAAEASARAKHEGENIHTLQGLHDVG